MPSNDDVSHSELVFNLFIEGELPQSITKEIEDKPELQVMPATTETKETQVPRIG